MFILFSSIIHDIEDRSMHSFPDTKFTANIYTSYKIDHINLKEYKTYNKHL